MNDRLSPKGNALVLLSGGQDSTTVLYWVKQLRGRLDTFVDDIEALTINYGQRHDLELTAAETVARMAGVKRTQIDLPDVLIGSSPLVNKGEQVDGYKDYDSLPGGIEKTFVAGRNILFLTLAGNFAYANNFTHIFIGVSEEDFGGYPDCRESFLWSMEEALNRGLFGMETEERIYIHAPLINKNKKATVQLAIALPGCWNALKFSHTCYRGERPPCGVCHACLLRQKGFDEAGHTDPLIEEVTK